MKLFMLQAKSCLPALLLTIATTAVIAQSKDPGTAPGSKGTVTFVYAGKKVTLATVRAKDGNIWLQQNLGSSAVATSVNDKAAYGDLFQWGRWDDGHQQREPANTSHKEATPSNPAGLNLTGKNPFLYYGINYWWLGGTDEDRWEAATPKEVTATNGCDPCKALGAGWHLPTIEEWRNVIDAEDITDGISNMNASLKLCFAGERNGNSALIDDHGKGGYYWSSTPTAAGGGAMVIIIQTLGINKTGGYYRGFGLSIRCVKNKQ